MEPGTYQLCVRSTNADGEWVSNQRLLTIIVKPSFWEAWYGKLLLTLFAIVVAATVVWTVLYIRRIKRQQRETLEKYLNLQGVALTSSSPSPLTADLDPMLQRVMKFVEENIANSDCCVRRTRTSPRWLMPVDSPTPSISAVPSSRAWVCRLQTIATQAVEEPTVKWCKNASNSGI